MERCKQKKFRVTGMTCAACSAHVEKGDGRSARCGGSDSQPADELDARGL